MIQGANMVYMDEPIGSNSGFRHIPMLNTEVSFTADLSQVGCGCDSGGLDWYHPIKASLIGPTDGGKVYRLGLETPIVTPLRPGKPTSDSSWAEIGGA